MRRDRDKSNNDFEIDLINFDSQADFKAKNSERKRRSTKKTQEKPTRKRKKQNKTPIVDMNTGKPVEKRKKKDKRPKKLSKGARRFITVSTFFVVILAALLLGVFLFFKVSDIEIKGDSIYSNEEILDVCGYHIGDNLFFLSTTDKEDKLKKELPYISEAKIKRKIPGTIEISITAGSAVSSIQNGSQYVYVDSKGKILEISDSAADSTMRVSGLKLENPTIGKALSFASEETVSSQTSSELSSSSASQQSTDEEKSTSSITAASAYNEIVEKLVELDLLSQMTSLDLSNVHNIILVYQNRVEMKLGNAAELSYKLKFGANILTGYHTGTDGQNEPYIGESEVGTLDLTNAKENNKVSFLPDKTRSSIDPTVDSNAGSNDSPITDEGNSTTKTYEPFASNPGRGEDIPDEPYTGKASADKNSSGTDGNDTSEPSGDSS